MEPKTCPMCNGTAPYLGNLGAWHYFRCENCGWQFSIPPRAAAVCETCHAHYLPPDDQPAEAHSICPTCRPTWDKLFTTKGDETDV